MAPLARPASGLRVRDRRRGISAAHPSHSHFSNLQLPNSASPRRQTSVSCIADRVPIESSHNLLPHPITLQPTFRDIHAPSACIVISLCIFVWLAVHASLTPPVITHDRPKAVVNSILFFAPAAEEISRLISFLHSSQPLGFLRHQLFNNHDLRFGVTSPRKFSLSWPPLACLARGLNHLFSFLAFVMCSYLICTPVLPIHGVLTRLLRRSLRPL